MLNSCWHCWRDISRFFLRSTSVSLSSYKRWSYWVRFVILCFKSEIRDSSGRSFREERFVSSEVKFSTWDWRAVFMISNWDLSLAIFCIKSLISSSFYYSLYSNRALSRSWCFELALGVLLEAEDCFDVPWICKGMSDGNFWSIYFSDIILFFNAIWPCLIGAILNQHMIEIWINDQNKWIHFRNNIVRNFHI